MSILSYTRPLKFVVVGGVESGKTSLIEKFISGEYSTNETVSTETYQPTSVCDGYMLDLKARVNLREKDGGFSSADGNQIAKMMLGKSRFSFASDASTSSVDGSKVGWNDIKVELQEVELKFPRDRKQLQGKRIVKSVSEFDYDVYNYGTQTGAHSDPSGSDCDSQVTKLPKPAPIKRSLTYSVPKQGRISPAHGEVTPRIESDLDVVDIQLDLWDTGGDKKYTWYRWYACTGADVVLLCVPLSSILTFAGGYRSDNETQNEPRISKCLQNYMSEEFLSVRTRSEKSKYTIPPVLLVGTKSDLSAETLNGSECPENGTIENARNHLVDSIGLALAAETECCDFVACSALTGANLIKVFETAISVSLTSNEMYRACSERKLRATSLPPKSEKCDLKTADVAVEKREYFKMHSIEQKLPNVTIESPPSTLPEANPVHGEFMPNKVKQNTESRSLFPHIVFPPPPTISPPSTLPPSSDVSLSDSTISSSLESLIDSTSERIDDRLDTMSLGSRNSDVMVSDDGQVSAGEMRDVEHIMTKTRVEMPVATPRRKVNIDMTQQCNKPSPKPRRRQMPSPKPTRLTVQKRMDRVFVNFLMS